MVSRFVPLYGFNKSHPMNGSIIEQSANLGLPPYSIWYDCVYSKSYKSMLRNRLDQF